MVFLVDSAPTNTSYHHFLIKSINNQSMFTWLVKYFFVTNTELPSEIVVISYEKRCNSENYIKEAKYDMAVGHLLLKSFWANEAVFQMMMLSYNLFLLFKFDFLCISEYRQQIKTFRLKYVFLAGKIIRTARSVIMKLSEKYPYQEVYERCLS